MYITIIVIILVGKFVSETKAEFDVNQQIESEKFREETKANFESETCRKSKLGPGKRAVVGS
jgi:hypothetical protein